MKSSFSPSVNIVRDEEASLDYVITPNAERVAHQISSYVEAGFRAFTIIGSYGSGKSSFLWALEKDLKKEASHFKIELDTDYDFLKLVGEFASLREILAYVLKTGETPQEIFGRLKTKRGLILIIDEFGKFIEYAVRNKPEEEIYFLQQLAEFTGDVKNKCLLLTTLHQSFDAYASSFLKEEQRNEWRKVKGRFKDLTFNEPVEQLLFLAAQKIDGKHQASKDNVDRQIVLQEKHNIIKSDSTFLKEIASKLNPLDIFSSYLLAVGLQNYGQNERSLFTYLEGDLDRKVNHLTISDIYDYLRHEFYSFLKGDSNLDRSAWNAMQMGLEKVESYLSKHVDVAQEIVKTIGLITLLGHKGAKLDNQFLEAYVSLRHPAKNVNTALKELEKKKIILFTRYSESFRLIDGTDVDFTAELKKADQEVSNQLDIVPKLQEHFQFSVVNAKSITYKIGTPRFFEYVISEDPLVDTPEGQTDGFINLIFNQALKRKSLLEISNQQEETLYAYFKNTGDIQDLLIDVERTTKARGKHMDDRVAREEFDIILNSQKQLLHRYVLDALFTNQVEWVYGGKDVKIANKKELNQHLSKICELVYHKTPAYKNELINRFVLQGGIAAKKPYYKALVKKYHLEDFGFESFGPEKTIYLTLLKETGIHYQEGTHYQFGKPNAEFENLWAECEAFLESAKKERKSITELFDTLSRKPFKLTPGFLDFWIPTFLFIKRDEFALFSESEEYQPELTDSHLHYFTRNPDEFQIKTFDVTSVKLDLYNKYRELLQLKDEKNINSQSLIESVKPFLVFYRHLPEYAKKTQRLSPEAKALRESIVKAKDPEKLFFEQFPKAVGVSLKELLKDQNLFDVYIQKMREGIRELQSCFEHLIDRIEQFLTEELLKEKGLEFSDYKEKVAQRFSTLKEHTLTQQQAALLIRLRSPLEDRNSWINSLCHLLLGKSLDMANDKEEVILKDKWKQAFRELDNFSDLSKEKVDDDEKVIKVDITSFDEGMKETVIRLPKSVDDEVLDGMNNVKKALGKKKDLNKFILANLLKDLLND